MKAKTKQRKKTIETLSDIQGEDWLAKQVFQVMAKGKNALDTAMLEMGRILAEGVMYMEREEMMERLGLTAEDLDRYLEAAEAEKLIALYRQRGGIALAKATYAGLKKAKPQEHYMFFPDFVDKEREIF